MTPAATAVAGYYLDDEEHLGEPGRTEAGKRTAPIMFVVAIRRTLDDSLVFRAPNVKEGLRLIRRLQQTTKGTFAWPANGSFDFEGLAA